MGKWSTKRELFIHVQDAVQLGQPQAGPAAQPYGLPLAAIWLLGKVQDLKFAIQDKVYG